MKRISDATKDIISKILISDGFSLEEAERILRQSSEQPDRKNEKMLTRKQAAEILGCSAKSIERYAQQGYFEAVRYTSRRIRYRLSEIERFKFEGVVT